MFKLDGSPLPSFLPTVGPHLHYLARSDRPGNSLSWAGGLLGGVAQTKGFWHVGGGEGVGEGGVKKDPALSSWRPC